MSTAWRPTRVKNRSSKIRHCASETSNDVRKVRATVGEASNALKQRIVQSIQPPTSGGSRSALRKPTLTRPSTIVDQPDCKYRE